MRRAKTAFKNHLDNFAVYRNLQADGTLADCIGRTVQHENYDSRNLKTFTSGINRASNPTKYDSIRTSVAPFQVLTAPQQVVGGAGITADNMAKIIESSLDRAEKKRFKSRYIKSLSFFTAGEADFKAGTVA